MLVCLLVRKCTDGRLSDQMHNASVVNDTKHSMFSTILQFFSHACSDNVDSLIVTDLMLCKPRANKLKRTDGNFSLLWSVSSGTNSPQTQFYPRLESFLHSKCCPLRPWPRWSHFSAITTLAALSSPTSYFPPSLVSAPTPYVYSISPALDSTWTTAALTRIKSNRIRTSRTTLCISFVGWN